VQRHPVHCPERLGLAEELPAHRIALDEVERLDARSCHAGHCTAPSAPGWWQATIVPWPVTIDGVVVQLALALAQRGEKAHPSGRADGDGTVPEMADSRVPGVRPKPMRLPIRARV